MPLRGLRRFVLFSLIAPILAYAGGAKPCITADQASKLVNKDVCVTAHVFDVVELSNGTRFLDVCTPETPDDACRFTIVSLREDRDDVGELRKYKDMNVHIRGTVQPMHGRSGMMLSNAAVLRRPSEVQAKPAAGTRIQCRRYPASSLRSQSPLTGRPARVHEYARPGDASSEVNILRRAGGFMIGGPSKGACVVALHAGSSPSPAPYAQWFECTGTSFTF